MANKNLVLAAMVFAVAMTFIDQTIVAIAIPDIQRELSLTATGSQWVINGYLLALSALFAFGGKLADVAGRKRMVVIGVIGFALTSALCGATPKGGAAEAWLIVFRVLQGASAALMFPAAVGIVVASFPLHERGRAMAIFFGIAGGLTAIGPIAGGFLTQWTWRSIFWINVPVAIVALILIRRARLRNEVRELLTPVRHDLAVHGDFEHAPSLGRHVAVGDPYCAPIVAQTGAARARELGPQSPHEFAIRIEDEHEMRPRIELAEQVAAG